MSKLEDFKNYNPEKNSKIKNKDSTNFYNISQIFYKKKKEPLDFEIGSLIFTGTFGSTFEACINSKCKYILKKINLNQSGQYTLEDFNREIHIQNLVAKYKLTSPIKLAYYIEESNECGFIMKRYEKTLIELLEDEDISLKTKKKYLKKVRSILEKLVLEVNVIHGDTHLANFMIDKKGKLKLIDFGASSILEEDDYRKKADSEMFTSSLRDDLDDISEDDKDELLEYWEEIMEDFDDYIS